MAPQAVDLECILEAFAGPTGLTARVSVLYLFDEQTWSHLFK
jgi:hypothetical protein